jgi:hypothetical protein
MTRTGESVQPTRADEPAPETRRDMAHANRPSLYGSVAVGLLTLNLSGELPQNRGLFAEAGIVSHERIFLGVRGAASEGRPLKLEGGTLDVALTSLSVVSRYRYAPFGGRVELRPGVGLGFARVLANAHSDTTKADNAKTDSAAWFAAMSLGVAIRPIQRLAWVGQAGVNIFSRKLPLHGPSTSVNAEASPANTASTRLVALEAALTVEIDF